MRKSKNRKQEKKALEIELKKQKIELKKNKQARDSKYQEWLDLPKDQWTDARKNRIPVDQRGCNDSKQA